VGCDVDNGEELRLIVRRRGGVVNEQAKGGATSGGREGRILLEREKSPCTVIVREVAGEDVAQVRLAQNEDVVQTFIPRRTD
jgi:hypothetical protein